MRQLFSKYQMPEAAKSVWQLINTFLPFFLLWYLMYLSLGTGYWLTLLLAIPEAGFMVRIFILQHDCGHGSFFRKKKANSITGLFCSLFTWTPYFYWKKGHGIHHANAGNLSHRGIGDVYTMTVREYLSLTRWGKLKYRMYRSPIFLFVIIPSVVFILWYRFPTSMDKALRRVESSVYWTDLALFILNGIIIYLIGFKDFLLIQLPIIILATSAGQWLFYVQHQYEDTYWEEKSNWDFSSAGLMGSSYYRLPKILQWFTGNIGFHHIHHLNPAIPNYRLEKCHTDNPVLQKASELTILSSLKTLKLRLWDEERQKLIGFNDLKRQTTAAAG